MKTIRKVEVKIVFCHYIPKEMEQNVIYISEEFEIENIESIQNNLFNVLEWANMEKYYLGILEEKCLEKIKE